MSTTTKPSFQMPPLPAEHQATQKVAQRFYELCSTGKNEQAMRDLYADNARHVEVMDGPGCARITDGKKSLLEKAEHFARTTTIHSASCGKPIVNGDQFICTMSMDCTCSEGPMANMRMNMSETCLYTVRNGKIVEGKFFYDMCGG